MFYLVLYAIFSISLSPFFYYIFNEYIADEVESLAAARQAALSGSEPSDSIRVLFLNSIEQLVIIHNMTFFG